MRSLVAMTSLALLCCACGSPPAPAPASAPAAPPATIDVVGMRSLEEETESAANTLLDLCVAARDGNVPGVQQRLAERVSLALPEPGEAKPEWKRITRTEWTVAPASELPARSAAEAIDALVARWSDAEDVRIKVKSAALSHDAEGVATLDGKFKSWIVGRNGRGLREWLRGEGHWAARRVGDAWLVSELAYDKAWSLTADADFVSEVSGPAGMRRRDPSLAERGGRGLLAHGAAAADVDLDGLIDVFATGLGSHALFRNRGDGTFEDVAASAGVSATPAPGGGPLFLDADGDGDQDLFVTGLGKQTLLENRIVPDGRLVFRDVSSAAGLLAERSAFSAAAGDVTGDGRPDIFVACYEDYGRVVPDSWDGATNGQPDLLFVNEGGLRFREAAAERGCADARWGYAALVADADEDADLDIVVANDFGASVGLFLNDGGRFRDAAAERGLGAPSYGMGLSLGDFDRDARLDLHVTKMSSNAGRRILGRFEATALPTKATLESLSGGNTLYRNAGGGRFEDVTAAAGPFPSNWAWGGGFFDLDNDTWPDLYVPNGFLSGSTLHDT